MRKSAGEVAYRWEAADPCPKVLYLHNRSAEQMTSTQVGRRPVARGTDRFDHELRTSKIGIPPESLRDESGRSGSRAELRKPQSCIRGMSPTVDVMLPTP